MNLLPLILAKRDGAALDADSLRAFVAAVSADAAPAYQVSALLMAILCRGMNAAETVALTRAMAESGDCHDWSHLALPTVDKHSTGGVGDKVSLVLAPLVAALGAAVPMLSGRGLGFTGGTLDKLASIPGFDTQLDEARFRSQVAALGCAFIGQSERIAPADRRLYALRDVTGTVESLPLIVSSILSKKIAAGPAALVIDLKVGAGAFMRTLAEGRVLGAALRETAASFGLRCTVLYSRMETPLGRSVGNRPELREALALLDGDGPAALRELIVVLAVLMLELARGGARSDLRAECEAALDGGLARERFLAVVVAQGGRLDPQGPDWGLPAAPAVQTLRAVAAGYMPAPDAAAVGRLGVGLGAGRVRVEDAVDAAAGIVFLKEWGEAVTAGEPVARVEGSDPQRVAATAAALAPLLAPLTVPPAAATLLLGLEDSQGFRPLHALTELLADGKPRGDSGLR
jgi:pyrimidine-nucleoside phosphorylase